MKNRGNTTAFWERIRSHGIIKRIRMNIRELQNIKRHYFGVSIENILKPYMSNYSAHNPIKELKEEKVVIVTVDNKFRCGLSDRLSGIVSAYNHIKKLQKEGVNVDFKIHFTHPLELSEYLEPNKYDWRVSDDDISYNPSQAEVIVLNTQKVRGVKNQGSTKMEYLEKRIKEGNSKQIHLYTNIIFCEGESYSRTFNELFKPSDRLQDALNAHTEILTQGGGYLSTSFRFMDLLGDFNEGSGITLNKRGQAELIQRCIEQLKKLRIQNPTKRILVASDSGNFLKRAQTELPYVYIVEGDVTHMGNTKDSSFELHLKTFVDYLMIARAEKIYLLRTGKMYNSRFPYTASMINNRPFERIEF